MDINYLESLLEDYILVIAAVVLAVIVILFILNIVTLVKLGNLKKKYRSFMEGKDAASLENTILHRFQEVDELKLKQELQETDLEGLKENMLKTYQKFGLVKYDAFHEMGGRLSFSLTMLDKKNNGFLLTTVHNTEGSYTYVKEILDGKSQIDLSEEEEKSLSKAVSKN
ncbi:MAG: DUF4446 family protein [Lachnospiraceae bacterium]|nr:DUF4446 family protein [Lachnospiraceae bacterium]